MRIKLDEDLPKAAAQSLRKSGYDVATAGDQGMGGCSDSELWAAVQKEQRLLITADKGFADIRLHPPGYHAGVLLLRPAEDGVRPVLELLDTLLRRYRLEKLIGAVAVATPGGVRLRRNRGG